jgi:hypothetical protein
MDPNGMDFDLGFYPSRAYSNDQIAAMNQQASDLLTNITTRVENNVASKLSDNAKAADQISLKPIKAINKALSSQWRVLNNLDAKIGDHINSALALQYARVHPLGIAEPSANELLLSSPVLGDAGKRAGQLFQSSPELVSAGQSNHPIVSSGGANPGVVINPPGFPHSPYSTCYYIVCRADGSRSITPWQCTGDASGAAGTPIGTVGGPFATLQLANVALQNLAPGICATLPPVVVTPPPIVLPPICPPGELLDPVTGECVSPPVMPPMPTITPTPGSSCDNPLYITTCNPPSSQAVCPPGQTQKPDGTCEVTQAGPCPIGQEKNEFGECEITAPASVQLPQIVSSSFPWCNVDTCQQTATLFDGTDPAPVLVQPITKLLSYVPLLGNALGGFIGTWMDRVTQGLSAFACFQGEYKNILGLRWALGFARQWTGLQAPEVSGALDYVAAAHCPWQIPGAGQVNTLYLANLVSANTWQCWTNMHGLCTGPAQLVLDSQRTKPCTTELIDLRLRDAITDQQMLDGIRACGVTRDEDKARYLDYLRVLPSSQEVIRYEFAGLWDQETVVRYYAGSSLTDDARYWLSTRGLSWNTSAYGPGTKGPGESTAADLAFAASLQWPSPGQAVQLLWALQPNRERKYEPEWMQQLEFTDQDARACFARAGQLPYFQLPLASLGVQFPTMRVMQRLVRYGQATKDDIVDWFSRIGTPREIARKHADALFAQETERRNKQDYAQARAKIQSAWEAGVIADAEFMEQLIKLGLTPEDAQTTVSLATAEYHRVRVVGTTKAIKRGYLRGVIDDVQLRSDLDQLGISVDRVNDMVDDWRIEKGLQRKEVPAGALVKAACNGLIGVPDVIRRLRNLQYRDEDIQIFLGEINLCTRQKTLKLLAQGEQKLRQQDALQQRELKAAQSAVKQAQSDLSRHGSPRELAKWMCEGLIGADETLVRLKALGWPDDDSFRLLEESCPGIGKATIAKLVVSGDLSLADGVQRLENLGLSPSDALLYIQSHEPKPKTPKAPKSPTSGTAAPSNA